MILMTACTSITKHASILLHEILSGVDYRHLMAVSLKSGWYVSSQDSLKILQSYNRRALPLGRSLVRCFPSRHPASALKEFLRLRFLDIECIHNLKALLQEHHLGQGRTIHRNIRPKLLDPISHLMMDHLAMVCLIRSGSSLNLMRTRTRHHRHLTSVRFDLERLQHLCQDSHRILSKRQAIVITSLGRHISPQGSHRQHMALAEVVTHGRPFLVRVTITSMADTHMGHLV
jgi:hypothetical protein